MRRQEASRYAGPSALLASRGGSAGGPPGPSGPASPGLDDMDLNPRSRSYLSPYATLPGEGGEQVSLPGPPPRCSVASIAKEVREQCVQDYRKERACLHARMPQLGLDIPADVLSRGLAPVQDKPFLECVSRLPKPGMDLESRPGSVKQAKRPAQSAKKRGARSARH